MPQPGMPSASGEDWLVRRVQDLERKVQELSAANVFGMTGIRPRDGGTEFDGYVKVNGSAEFTGDTTIGGNAKITGTLNLPAGIIGNESLATPISPGTWHRDTSGISLNQDDAVAKLAQTIPVPSGFTKALVMATVVLGAYNAGAKDDIALACKINGAQVGLYSQATVGAAERGTVNASASAVITGLSSSFTVGGHAYAMANTWASSPSNIMNLDVVVLFLR